MPTTQVTSVSPTKDLNFEELQKKRTKCEVWSRVVGYLRPVHQWNEGKQAEYKERVEFDIDTTLKSSYGRQSNKPK